uniref:CKLF like MARVEL transmembrane domain containing 7 n=1 Tax=Apteryx owenii TaxID=8824 RepID=A0A8B9S3V3_APTOW
MFLCLTNVRIQEIEMDSLRQPEPVWLLAAIILPAQSSPLPCTEALPSPSHCLLFAFSVWTDYSAYSYFQIVTMCDLVMILFFYIVHIFRIYRLLTCISWPLAEFLHYLIGTILLLIASIVAASKSYNLTGLVAGATFGFLATILCVLSIWSSYKVSCITQSTDAAV